MRRLIVATAALAAAYTITATDADARRDRCHTRACVERVARKACDQRHVIPCIRRAALHYHQPFGDMLRVARCESSLDPFNEYAGHHGLYQYLTSTWATTPYRARFIYSAKWQALATGWMWAHGRRGEWACR